MLNLKQRLYNWLVRNEVRRPVVLRPGPAPVRPPIAIVTAYFGNVPIWAPVFFVSARKNPDVQFFVYTDLELNAGGVKNVTVKHMTIADFNKQASEAIGTPIEVQHHLAKMSDLKPAYGMIFADDLKDFAYWAYTDFDVAWGDIRKFLTDDLLHAHDIVSSRSDRLCGHFTLFRNTPEYNRTYELIPDVIRAMGHSTHFHLDEIVLTKYLKKAIGKWPLASTARVYWKSNWTIDAKYQRVIGDGPNDRLWWRDGKTFDVEGRELMYLHFHKLKKDMPALNFGPDDSPTAFSISRKGILA